MATLNAERPTSRIEDPVPLISNEFVDTRSAFLEKCQMYHWQFDELRNAQHSTLMLLYYLHGKHKEAKAKMAAQAQKEMAASSSLVASPGSTAWHACRSARNISGGTPSRFVAGATGASCLECDDSAAVSGSRTGGTVETTAVSGADAGTGEGAGAG